MSYTIYQSACDLQEHVCQILKENHCLHTLEHVLKVANQAKLMAIQWHSDVEKCYQAALLHDISAIMPRNEMYDFALQQGWQIDQACQKYPFLLHQRISAWMASQYFGIDDEEVLSAISCRTTLKREAGDIDMIVFLADKIAWDQSGIPPYLELIETALPVSLEKACWIFLDDQLKNHRILYPHQWLLEAYQDLKMKLERKGIMKKYKAIIYDIDGTVLNTLNMNMYPLMKIIKEELNEDWSFEDVLKFAAYPGMKVMEELGIQDKEKTYARWVQYVNAYEEGASLYEGFETVFPAFQKAGIIQAVVSAKTKAQYQIDMVDKGLDQYMEVAILAEDTTKHKPDPEPLLECIKRLQVDLTDVIYIGDAKSDALASLNAHINFGYAKWGNVLKEDLEGATFIFEKPLDLLGLIDATTE
ncbi:bis(5'-nucleosyl)-tetraphosphatase (symmetrical) YqeK [Allocoprobacillus halotolerans]|uniref:bis(5'-nucleosyl)-tetraphosphatase (symmetrical) n=1 Tax=Allocoprobacillus halotolerans TaxID=2944914 RepID=A0ABY5HZJ4_9FIRM|nr:bis(5'-nucleosyl)-tetraphosphatase (symmetrical) YqeK [Allocoprobacillus halotolerans]UTY37972.1 bis(5'-nucleosyl)-tetraphosphatase (symmetrical) YqeK [Allocoprobacillus halotolerans]